MTSSNAGVILSTIGTVCWCIQLIPQIYHNFRRKNCEGLNPMMFFLWCASGVPFSIYFVSRGADLPIQIQPQLFTFFSTIAWWQSLFYPPVAMNWKKATAYVTGFVVISAGFEVGCILPVRNAYNDGKEWPSLIFGVIASILLALGLVPPYFELAKRQGRVIGINFVFLTLDFSGAFFSVLSLGFEDTLDILGVVLYSIVAAMEAGIFVSQLIWWLRFGRRLKKERSSDDVESQFDSENQLDSEKTRCESLTNDEHKLSSDNESALDPEETRQEEIKIGHVIKDNDVSLKQYDASESD